MYLKIQKKKKEKEAALLHNVLFSPWSSYCHITQICPVGLFIDLGPYKETAKGTKRLFLSGREQKKTKKNSRSHTDEAAENTLRLGSPP